MEEKLVTLGDWKFETMWRVVTWDRQQSSTAGVKIGWEFWELLVLLLFLEKEVRGEGWRERESLVRGARSHNREIIYALS